MRALIADDEPHLAEDLRRRLARFWPELEIVALLTDGVAAAQALRDFQPDIAFLDIRMPGQSGMQAAQQALPGCRVVFVTAYDQYAVQAFDQAASDYLLKPLTDERLQRCLARLRPTRVAPVVPPLRWLPVTVGNRSRMLALEEVCYFQSADKYTTVQTAREEFLVRTPLKELLPQLDPAQFWQVHRGTVVNVRKIREARPALLGRWELSLRDRPEMLTVSRSYAHLFRRGG